MNAMVPLDDMSTISPSHSHKQAAFSRIKFNKHKRLLSLDVLRGFSVLLSIFVNNIGTSWPYLSTSPWNGLFIGDIVQPFFLFVLGISIVLSMNKYRKVSCYLLGFKHAMKRFIKLFTIGLLMEGGGEFTADYDLTHLRIFGVLQRIAVCYLFCALLELFLPPLFRYDVALTPSNSLKSITSAMQSSHQSHHHQSLAQQKSTSLLRPFREEQHSQQHIPAISSESESEGWKRRLIQSFSVYKMYIYHWIVFALLLIGYALILFTVRVPNSYGETCGYNVLTPVCNPISHIDVRILTKDHMYFPINTNDAPFQRTKECSSCNPGKCTKEDAQIWCSMQPFEPYGIVSTITAIMAVISGMHIGHLFMNFSERNVRMLHLLMMGILQCLIAGLLIESRVNALNASLYSVSYLCLTSGIAYFVLIILYYFADVKVAKYRRVKRYIKSQRRKKAQRALSGFRSPVVVKSSNDSLWSHHKHEANGGNGYNSLGNTNYTIEEDERWHAENITHSTGTTATNTKESTNTTTKSSNLRSIQSENLDLDLIDPIEPRCPLWCCCFCEHLPCVRWDWRLVNVLDTLLCYPLECLGRNAFIIYILAGTNVTEWILSIFYWDGRKQCLTNILWPNGVYWGPDDDEDSEWRNSSLIMLWTCGYCMLWTIFAIYLRRIKWHYVV